MLFTATSGSPATLRRSHMNTSQAPTGKGLELGVIQWSWPQAQLWKHRKHRQAVGRYALDPVSRRCLCTRHSGFGDFGWLMGVKRDQPQGSTWVSSVCELVTGQQVHLVWHLAICHWANVDGRPTCIASVRSRSWSISTG